MIGCYIGYSALILFIYSVSYKKINKFIGHIKMNRLLKAHYIVGTAAVILAAVHAYINMTEISITLGTISLFFMICTFIAGLLIGIFKGKKRNVIVNVHIVFSILMLMSVVFHIIEYYILK